MSISISMNEKYRLFKIGKEMSRILRYRAPFGKNKTYNNFMLATVSYCNNTYD